MRRVNAESDITTIDNTDGRARRQVGRRVKAEEYREVQVRTRSVFMSCKIRLRCANIRKATSN